MGLGSTEFEAEVAQGVSLQAPLGLDFEEKKQPLLPAGHRGNITKLQLFSKQHKQNLPLSISSGPGKDKRFYGNSSGTKTLPAANITSSSVRTGAQIHADQGHAGSTLVIDLGKLLIQTISSCGNLGVMV